MRRRFFVEGFANGRATLRGEAAHHLGHVLRAEPGQLYELSDGHAVWLARVERAAAESVEFSVVEPIAAAEPRLRATLLLAVVKFDRFEWALEKATELGVEVVMPLAAERSQRPLRGGAEARSPLGEDSARIGAAGSLPEAASAATVAAACRSLSRATRLHQADALRKAKRAPVA